MSKIIDVITYNGEKEIWDLRYNVLSPFVDEFRIIEFDQTFSGKPKSPTFNQNWPKVKYYYVTEATWSKYEDLAKSSPNTQYGQGAEHWVREFCMKESIKDCLTDLKDDDIVFIGDCDEIWDSKCLKSLNELCNLGIPVKLKLKVYSYYLNNLSNEQFWGTIIAKYKDIKNECLNHARSFNCFRTSDNFGRHFTSLKDNLRKKLTDSYTKDSYASDLILDNLKDNIENSKDFLGRDFTYKIDETLWPQYLKDNRDKYKQLCLTKKLENSMENRKSTT